jgi:hypothetical protein
MRIFRVGSSYQIIASNDELDAIRQALIESEIGQENDMTIQMLEECKRALSDQKRVEENRKQDV